MSDKFFILGLPRSRTYWMSCFMGCIHEGLFYYPNYEDFMASDQIGDCTTAYEGIKDYIKGEKKVIIHRDIDEVKRSVRRVLGNIQTDFLDGVAAQLREEDGLHIEFNDINDRIEEIWEHCRNKPFPEATFLALKDVRLDNHVLIERTRDILNRMSG